MKCSHGQEMRSLVLRSRPREAGLLQQAHTDRSVAQGHPRRRSYGYLLADP
jgi:hypothetical protein